MRSPATLPCDLLTSVHAPAVHVIQTSGAAFSNLTRALLRERPDAVVRKVRGRKSHTTSSFFDEVGAALQFPYYFGENWNALSDVLRDLDWLPGAAYLLMISDAEQLLLEADADDFRVLMEILSRMRVEWLTPNLYCPRNRSPAPFHVLLQVADEEGYARLSDRLLTVAAEFDGVVGPSADPTETVPKGDSP